MKRTSRWVVLAVAVPLVVALAGSVTGQPAPGAGAPDDVGRDLRELIPEPPGLAGQAWGIEQLGWFLLFVLGAIASGAALAYHPHSRGRVASLEGMDQPKIIITYTVVGALIGILVALERVMAFAIFGIGGLMRFRTELQSAKDTGRVILATVIGICWGSALWGPAISTTVVAWLLIFILDWKVGYRILIRGIDRDTLGDSAEAYEGVLDENDCQITQVKRNLKKNQISIVFKASRKLNRDKLEVRFHDKIPSKLQGTVDWPEEG